MVMDRLIEGDIESKRSEYLESHDIVIEHDSVAKWKHHIATIQKIMTFVRWCTYRYHIYIIQIQDICTTYHEPSIKYLTPYLLALSLSRHQILSLVSFPHLFFYREREMDSSGSRGCDGYSTFPVRGEQWVVRQQQRAGQERKRKFLACQHV